MKKEFNKIEDFIEDVSFNRWINEKSETDRLIWETWKSNHPDKIDILEEAADILNVLDFNIKEPSAGKVAEQLEQLHNSIAAKEAAYQQPKQNLRSLARNNFLKMAAAIAFLMVIGLVISFFLNESVVNHHTNFGELKEIQLPDGSKIALNANSTLRYESTNPRKVWLEGEAFFEVAKKPTTGENFQVLTSDLTVEVLGTVFNVKNRAATTSVFLEEGKVKVAIEKVKTESIELAPGELIRYTKNKQKSIQKQTAKAIDNTAWKDGIIRFKEATLTETLAEISVLYGIKFEIEDDLLSEELFSGGIPLNDRKIMVATLKDIFKIEIEEDGSRYRISKSLN